MIEFDIEIFWKKLSFEHLNGGHESIMKYGVTHNHNNLLYEYRKTEHFLNEYSKTPDTISKVDTEKIWNENYKWFENQNKKIQDKTNKVVLNNFIEEVVKKYSNYLTSKGKKNEDRFFRFGENHLKHVKCKTTIQSVYNTYNKIYKNNLPEQIKYQDICGGLWSMCDANLSKDVVTIGNFFLNKLKDKSFVNKYDRLNGNGSIDNIDRMFLSISWPTVQCLKHLGRIDDAKQIYKDIITKTNSNNIFWSCGLNRSLEAGIELYKLEPTEKLKEWCYNILYELTNRKIENDTEALNERFLISYMFYKHIMKKVLK